MSILKKIKNKAAYIAAPLSFLLLILSCKSNKKNETLTTMSQNSKGSVHDFIVKDIKGKDFDLSSLKGKKVMIVNTASKCGLTPQYEGLQTLYEKYEDSGFSIVGFPANNFMGQEPGGEEEIQKFCSVNYGVSFPMMSKVSVKGDDIHPLFAYLTKKENNGMLDNSVSWNFQKFLIDEDGKISKVFSPQTLPLDKEIIAWIEN